MHRSDTRLSRRSFLATAAASAAAPMFVTDGSVRAETSRGNNAPAARLRAGAASVKVTPPLGVSLEGYFMKLGPVTGVHDDLFARCLVLDDGSERIALLICDMTVIPGEVFSKAKKLVHEETGLPMDRMLMACTHTHSAPRIGLGQGELDKKYVETLVRGMADAVCRAIGNLAPAKVGYGSDQKPEYTFNRRWWMKPGTIPADPFGRTNDRVQFNPPRGSKNLVKPAGPVDPEVSVLSVQHADGRPLALLANYSIHYIGGFKRGEISADYFGVFAKRIGELLGGGNAAPPFVGMMSNGTSGNIGASTSFRKRSEPKGQYVRMREVGYALADEAARVAKGLEYRDSLSLAMAEKDIELGIRRPDEQRIAWAKQILDETSSGKKHRWTANYAREALLLAEYPPTLPVKLQAVRIGELAIGAIPNEVFAETGLAVKESSPMEQTFVIELANQYHGYLPTPEQHTLGGYETWDARSSCLEVEAETKIRATVLDLIRQISSKARQ